MAGSRTSYRVYPRLSGNLQLSASHLIRIKSTRRRIRILVVPQSWRLELGMNKTLKTLVTSIAAVLILVLGSLLTVESALAAPTQSLNVFVQPIIGNK